MCRFEKWNAFMVKVFQMAIRTKTQFSMIILVPQTRREILETRGVVAKNPQTKLKEGTIVMEFGKMRHTRSSCTTIEKDGEILLTS